MKPTISCANTPFSDSLSAFASVDELAFLLCETSLWHIDDRRWFASRPVADFVWDPIMLGGRCLQTFPIGLQVEVAFSEALKSADVSIQRVH